jgi:hypothetical protein
MIINDHILPRFVDWPQWSRPRTGRTTEFGRSALVDGIAAAVEPTGDPAR